MKPSQRRRAHKWREMFQRRRRMRDPLLVFNMSIFNFDDGWNRIFSQLKFTKTTRDRHHGVVTFSRGIRRIFRSYQKADWDSFAGRGSALDSLVAGA